MQLQPYLMFEGKAEEAISFYRKAIGAEVLMMMRYNENPEPAQPGFLPPGSEEKIMHASLRVGTSEVLLSDGMCSGTTSFNGFSLSLTVDSEADAERYFKALAEGGNIEMPLARTFFSPSFGMLSDRFGVSWMVYVKPKA